MSDPVRFPRWAQRVLALTGLAGFLPYVVFLLQQWWADFELASFELAMPGLLVLPLVILLIARQPPVASAPPEQPSPAGALVTFGTGGLALALALAVRPIAAAPLLPVAAVGAWWAVRGVAMARHRILPLALLLLLPPAPRDLLALVQQPLSLLGAGIATGAGTLAGLQPVRTANVVRTATFYIQVIDSCSGLYMALMFLIVAVTLATLRSWQGRWAWGVIAAAAPLGLVLNGVRLSFQLVFGSHWPDLGVTTLAHDLPGLVLFALGAGLLGWVGEHFGRRTGASSLSSDDAAVPGAAPGN